MPPSKEAITKDKSGGNGLFGRGGDAVDRIIGNLFSGGNKDSGPSSSMRPQARPEYASMGTGEDKTYLNTRTGQTAAAPSYSGFSMRGLTSSDPGNYMRNQEAAARYNAMPQRESENRGFMGRNSGIASLVTPTPIAAPVPGAAPVVAPPSVPGPVEVPTMGYAGAPAMGAVPPGYGSAFAGLSQPMANPYGGMSLMDIFSMYPDLRYM
jgi:hypothetical protein